MYTDLHISHTKAHFDVNGYIFRGSNSGGFIYADFLKTLTGKKLPLWEQILSFKVRPFRDLSGRNQDPVVQSILSLISSLKGQLLKCFMTLP